MENARNNVITPSVNMSRPMRMSTGGSPFEQMSGTGVGPANYNLPGNTFPAMAVPQLRKGGELKTGHGGPVPGKGKGDKVPALYEPGEFVVSNDMLNARPELRKQLHDLRGKVLASQGKSVQQADAEAVSGETLKAQDGRAPMYPADRKEKDIYAGLGKPASAPENSMPPGGMLGGAREMLAKPASPQQPGPDYSPSVVSSIGTGLKTAGQNSVANAADTTSKTMSALAGGNMTGAYGQAMRGAVAAPIALAKDLAAPSLQAASAVGQGLKYVGQGVGNALNTLATGNSTKIFGVDQPAGATTPQPTVALPPTGAGAGRGEAKNFGPPGTGGQGDARSEFLARNPGVAANQTLSPGATPSQRINSFGDSAAAYSAANPQSVVRGGVTMQQWGEPGRSTGQPSAQDQLAMDGLQSRQDARDAAAANKMQYDQEVAGAQAANLAAARLGGYAPKGPSRSERDVMRIENEKQQMANSAANAQMQNKTALAGQDKTLAAQTMSNDTARAQLANTASTTQITNQGAQIDNEAKQQLRLAQQEYLAAGDDPVKLKAAERRLLVLSGKQDKPTKNFSVVPGTRVAGADGSQTVTPAYMVDASTGEYREIGGQPGQAGAVSAPTPKADYDKLPKGSPYTGTDGKQYTKG